MSEEPIEGPGPAAAAEPADGPRPTEGAGPAEGAGPTDPVPPLDVTGVRTLAMGTLAWLVAFLVLLAFRGRLAAHGDEWWMWAALAGVGLGVFGVVHCYRRERRLRSSDPRG